MDQPTPKGDEAITADWRRADEARKSALAKEAKSDRYAGLAREIETLIRAGRLDGIPEIARQIALMILGTPAAEWREKGLPDPHGDRYSRKRAATAGGHMTDDEVANTVFMVPSIEHLTIAKERIRWLSRSLIEAERNVRHWREECGKLAAKANPGREGLRRLALVMPPEDQQSLAAAIAANVGYVLVPEPQHPDCPHREPAAQPPHPIKLHSWGGQTGINDYLMSDGSVKAMSFEEAKAAGYGVALRGAPASDARPKPHDGPFPHWPRETHTLTLAQVAAIHAPELPDDALVTVAQLNEALTKLKEIAEADEHGRYGRLARETIACLAPGKP